MSDSDSDCEDCGGCGYCCARPPPIDDIAPAVLAALAIGAVAESSMISTPRPKPKPKSKPQHSGPRTLARKAESPLPRARTVVIEVNWEVREYIKLHLRDNTARLVDQEIAVGEPKKAYITTCREYLEWQKPRIGQKILDLVEVLAKSCSSSPSEETIAMPAGSVAALKLTDETLLTKLTMAVQSDVDTIMDVLTFLATVLRPVRKYEQSRVLKSEFEIIPTNGGNSFRVDLLPLEQFEAQQPWMKVWKGPCGPQFDVPKRPRGFVGAQLSVDTMMGNGNRKEQQILNRILLLINPDSMIYPVNVSKDQDNIQWNLSDDLSDKKPEDIFTRPARRKLRHWNFSNTDALQCRTHFLGCHDSEKEQHRCILM